MNGLTCMTTWVDVSYDVHNDMRVHTGGCITLGSDMIHCKSSKQKLNTKSSTETQVVGASDYIPFTIQVKYFIEAQGYAVEKNDFNQDNNSDIRLEKNGKDSSRQATRHIKIRYFFMKDRIREDDFNIIHCPTEIMVADQFTKLLQGPLFIKLRNVIMGYSYPSTLTVKTSPSDEERVEIRTVIPVTKISRI